MILLPQPSESCAAVTGMLDTAGSVLVLMKSYAVVWLSVGSVVLVS